MACLRLGPDFRRLVLSSVKEIVSGSPARAVARLCLRGLALDGLRGDRINGSARVQGVGRVDLMGHRWGRRGAANACSG